MVASAWGSASARPAHRCAKDTAHPDFGFPELQAKFPHGHNMDDKLHLLLARIKGLEQELAAELHGKEEKFGGEIHDFRR
jgi:hypothetical protein